MNGCFIVLEGPDGCGSSTHTRLLCESLRQHRHAVMETHEPSGGPIGQYIRACLKEGSLPHDALQLLFCADRAEHVSNCILPALNEQKIVICDRYSLSTELYGTALGLSREWLHSVNTKFIQPTHTILLLPSFDECASRLARRSERDSMEQDAIQRAVYDLYAAEHPSESFSIVDSSGDKSEVAAKIFTIVQEILVEEESGDAAADWM